MLLGAEDTTWFKSLVDSVVYLVDKVGWPGAALVLMAVAAIWYARRFAPKHEANIESNTTLNRTLSDHIPKQSETLRILAETVSEVSHGIEDVRGGQYKIAQAVLAASCPERLSTVNAHLGDILRKKKPEDSNG